MKFSKLIFLFLIISINITTAQKSFLTYYELRNFLQTSPGAFKFGLYGFDNPAMTSYLHDNDLLFSLSSTKQDPHNYNHWGLFSGSPYSGFGVIYSHDTSGHSVTDYRYSFSFGSRTFALGFGYGFVGEDKSYFNRSNTIHWGALWRPLPQFSLGFAQTYSLSKDDNESVVDIAIRPIGEYPLTFFADAAWFDNQKFKNIPWSAGISWEVVDGVRLNGRYFKDKSLSVGIDLSFGMMGVSSVSQFDENQKYNYNTYSVRLGALDRCIFDKIIPSKKYVKLDLSGQLKYQKFIWFDKANTLLEVIQQINYAKDDKNVDGIVVNATNLECSHEMLWEIREKLKEFKSTRKKVVIFIENPSIDLYEFATIADKIVIDPIGNISLGGYVSGRSYYKNMLDKIGIGLDEIRLFKYKSAYENFAQQKMSDADREQRQKLIDGWYSETSKNISDGRKISNSEFDTLVNSKIIYLAKTALDKHLVDMTGRWIDVDDIINKNIEKIDGFINAKSYTRRMAGSFGDIQETGENIDNNKPFDDYWSKPTNTIAVIYAVGVCAMDEGIKARSLVKDLQRAYNNSSIKAIVLRVDSPGGDAMASDYIAEVIRKNKGKKPLIISQGSVAASGGYWLSMDGDKIVASPITITGSIGVIGAFLYDKGLKDSLGISVDLVKHGKYADLGYPFVLPIIPIGIPARKLNDDERKQWEEIIMDMYKDFVDKVATGRKLKSEDIEKVAQGRVWTGSDGKEKGLVDELGGLDQAIKIALNNAGIKKEDEYHIVEYPVPSLFDFGSFFAGLFDVQITKADKKMEILNFLLKNNGKILPILPIDYFENLKFE